MSDRPAVFLVCGAGRSHTSHVAKMLHDAGLPMGDELMPPGPGNPHGYYEDTPAVKLNDRILAEHGHTWSTVGAALEPDRDTEWLVELVHGYISQRCRSGGDGSWGVKDPRLTVTMAYWLRAMRRFKVEPIILGCVRDTGRVADSLAKREGLDKLTALAVTGVYQDALAELASPAVTMG